MNVSSTGDSKLQNPFVLSAILRGIAFGLVGFGIGGGLSALLRLLRGLEAIEIETFITAGYPLGFVGWLLGMGVWDYWAREWLGKTLKVNRVQGWKRYFTFNMDHKVIGIQYLVTFVSLFLLAGLFAMLFRYELMRPGMDVLGPKDYNSVMGVHGIIMIAVAVTAFLGAFGNYIMPIMIGAEDMAFPRLNALSFWIIPPVGVAIFGSLFAEGWDAGWTAYPPLSLINASGQVLFNLGFFTLGLSSIAGGINFLVTIITMRAPGMTWDRLPIFVWSVFSTAILSAFFTQFIGLAMLMLLMDRILGFSFFDPANGGNPLLYQHVFWIYSHPAVYVMILPALGAALEIISHFARKPLFAYRWAVGGLIGIVIMSATVWAHHMFTAGISSPLQRIFLFSTELISIPTGFIFLSALGTIWEGKLWLKTPMLFALAVIANFLIGGLTGVFLADVPTDLHLHDTYFVVGHFHYTIVGGGIFGLFAAIYYWFPKITGRKYNERLAELHFWWMFISFNTTFLPMMWAGINGMNRRVADYLPQLGNINMWISISAFILGTSFVVFVYNMVRSWARGPAAEANPWKARTLEWQTSSPPPLENFEREPIITGHPYDYGVPGSVHVSWEPGVSAAD